jgi:hypothetical protein
MAVFMAIGARGILSGRLAAMAGVVAGIADFAAVMACHRSRVRAVAAASVAAVFTAAAVFTVAEAMAVEVTAGGDPAARPFIFIPGPDKRIVLNGPRRRIV